MESVYKKFVPVDAEYNKNTNLKKEDVQTLIQWLEAQSHLPNLSEIEVILFLDSCGYNIEYTKKCLDTFFTCRTQCPECFSDRSPALLKKWFDLALCTFLPGETPEGYKVMFVKVLDFNLYNLATFFKICCMVAEITILQKYGTVSGLITVYDMEGAQITQFMRSSPSTIKKVIHYLQEAMPVIRKGAHFINAVPLMDKVLALLKTFVKSEIMDMLHVHNPNQIEGLFEQVPKSMLPKDLGGEAPTMKELHEQMKKDLLDNEDMFELDKQRLVNLSLRPGKSSVTSNIFGIQGSFKKLDID